MALDMNIKELLIIGDPNLLVHRRMDHQECQDLTVSALQEVVQKIHED